MFKAIGTYRFLCVRLCVCLCEGKGQLLLAHLNPGRGGMTSSIQTSPLVEEKAPLRNTQRLGNNRNMVMGPDGTGNQD
jgi:hypothetical protein